MAEMKFDPGTFFMDVEGRPMALNSNDYSCTNYACKKPADYSYFKAVKDGTPISESEFREMLSKSES